MPTYSDGEMRAIMGRALQIDSGRSERFTPEQLRTIAAELGISTQALEVAMYEADSKGGLPMQPEGARSNPRTWTRGLAIAALGVILAAALSAIVVGRIAPRSVERAAPAAPIGVAPAAPLPAKVAPVPKATEPARIKTTTRKPVPPQQF
jgi:hypothetical protein